MKSILHDKKDRTCFLCMLLYGDDSYKAVLEEHHVFFGRALRKLSEKYGMKVYLCIFHHRTGKEAVHQNARINKMVQAYAQRTFEKKWPEKDFYGIFGKNYILEQEIESEIEEKIENSDTVAGFTPITDGIEGMDRKWDTDTYTATC